MVYILQSGAKCSLLSVFANSHVCSFMYYVSVLYSMKWSDRDIQTVKSKIFIIWSFKKYFADASPKNINDLTFSNQYIHPNAPFFKAFTSLGSSYLNGAYHCSICHSLN